MVNKENIIVSIKKTVIKTNEAKRTLDKGHTIINCDNTEQLYQVEVQKDFSNNRYLMHLSF